MSVHFTNLKSNSVANLASTASENPANSKVNLTANLVLSHLHQSSDNSILEKYPADILGLIFQFLPTDELIIFTLQIIQKNRILHSKAFSLACRELLSRVDLVPSTLVKEDIKVLKKIIFKLIELAPSNLNILSLLNIEIDEEDFKKIQKFTNLHYLYINVDLLSKSCFDNLPAHLTNLYLQGTKIESENLKNLPKYLAAINIACRVSDHSFLKDLPADLTELYLSHKILLDDRDIQYVPRKLTHFQINTKHLSLDGFKNLPQDLLDLYLFGENLENDWIDYLPQQLESFLLHHNDTLTDEAIAKLPKSLKKLSLKNNTKLTDDCVPNLPRTLNFIDFSASKSFTGHRFKELPSNLNELILDNFGADFSQTLTLPSKLEVLHMRVKHEDWLLNLPAGLKEIKIAHSIMLKINNYIFSPSLTSLHLYERVLLSDKFFIDISKNIKEFSYEGLNVTGEIIRRLPYTLTYLSVPKSNLTTFAMMHLPKNLTYLNLIKSEGIVDECIKHLPRSLKTLALRASLSDKGICHLPKKLQSLELDSINSLEDKSIQFLPRLLTRLSLINVDKLTNLAIDFLPKKLISINIMKNYNLLEEKLLLKIENLKFILINRGDN